MELQHLLAAMAHKQFPTTIRTDNSTATDYVNNNVQMKSSKSWDVNFHWLSDKDTLKILKIIWDKGKNNGTDILPNNMQQFMIKKIRLVYIRDVVN